MSIESSVPAVPCQSEQVKQQVAKLLEKDADLAEREEDIAAFSCNICYELAKEPVVSLCGHLYCWPCVYRWMCIQQNCRTCPVCKAGIDEDKVIPIYGRGACTTDPRANKKPEQPTEAVPRRPSGQRPTPVQRHPTANGQGQVSGQQGLGFVPTLFGLQGSSGGGYAEPLTPEQQHQAFLSRLLLMLGSFVIMCLLLF